MTLPLAGLVLAAGFSRRMGRCKLTLPLHGEPLLRHVVRAARQAGLAPLGVVIRPDSDDEVALRAALSGWEDLTIVPALEAHLGQSESLKAGVRWLLAGEHEDLTGEGEGNLSEERFPFPLPRPLPCPSKDVCTEVGTEMDAFRENRERQDCGKEMCSGVVVLLGDQPLVSAGLIKMLREVFQEHPECAVAPAYEGVRGNPVILPHAAFRDVLQLSGDTGARHLLVRFGLRLVPTNDRAAITDVDTWEAYQRLQTL